MSAEVLRLGPFSGGMNIGSDPSLIGDNELINCLNLELDNDGSLVSRPAIQIIDNGFWGHNILIFGAVVFSGTLYLFGMTNIRTYISTTGGLTWTELAPGGLDRECITMAVYNNTVWLPTVPGAANGGMTWTPGGGAVALASLPRAASCIVHKNRLYLCPGSNATVDASRLKFSAAADFTTWPAPNFIDVQPGDGDTLNNIAVYQDNLLLFKGESTHVLAYDLDPSDAILREINPVVGSTGNFGIAQHENAVYTLHTNKLYEINNFNFTNINEKIPPVFDNSLPTGTTVRFYNQHLSTLGDRLIVRYYNRTYSYMIKTRTWSEWRKTDDSSIIEWHIFSPLVRARDLTGSGLDAYYAGYSLNRAGANFIVIKIIDGRTSGAEEGTGSHKFYCIATTKDYDMSDPIRYKRLFWWGVDVVTGQEVTGSVKPITLVNSISWNALISETWADLLTWGSPLLTTAVHQEIISGDGVSNTNKMIKFGKAVRFRKINFSLRLETDGSPNQPTKIFQYIAVVGTKQIVSARVT